MANAPASIHPFDECASAEALADLRARLVATRWPDVPEVPGGVGWSPGADQGFLRDLVAHWIDGFDWPAAEAKLARLPRFRTEVGGLGIHFVHARGAATPSGRPALPLLLNHGWPDSFWRYSKVVGLLADPGAHGADPEDAFDVIVPDMPGFGYSDAPVGGPLDSRAVAALWAELLGRLGHDRFVTAGGDIGSHVSRYLALDFPDRVVAVHRMDAGLPVFGGAPSELSPAEQRWFEASAAWNQAEGAYGAMHRTKPQTAAAALNDSPVGLAAWIVEKLHAWSDGGVGAYTMDEILTNVTLYWLTGTIGSSMRMYSANAALPKEQLLRRVEVPSGFSIFHGDIVRPPREWIERTANAVRITEPARGGHFAPFEQPELYAQELRDFFRPFRGFRAG
ncbi:multidrug MFS transporter [Subtercola boreus]|uniref:Multidrug MFS transporter n=1 Tax=Subtercola boreus TaxID=120213 RepID=A0A3E0VDT7_9MICO|nr:epoxide hydrolase family protein [Subtercola boreus]RFA07911.1 multidrug MFS transporter [Subtercola boreus]TQL55231.1 pimeloyl-ACP methyl ester carboxylesterase [Subtercola boreus]